MEKVFEKMIEYLIPFFGLLFGFINGKISTYFLSKYIKATNKKFFTAFGLTLLYKLIFLILSVWLIRAEKVIIILLYCFFLISFQIVVVFKFFRYYGIKRDS